MHECLYKDDRTKCPFNDPDIKSCKGKCLWLTYDILSHPICRNPWHGMTKDAVDKIKKGEK